MTDQITTTARATDTGVRIQIWTSELAIDGITMSATIPTAEAEKLIRRLQAAIAELPREVSAADLGLAA